MFIKTLETLLQAQNIQKKIFLSELGLNKNSFAAWRSRGTIPSGTVLQKIADYFGVTVDYLLGKEESDNAPSDNKFECSAMFLTNLEELLRERKIQKKVFLSDLNLAINSFRNWRDRGNLPNGETLIKIADYFGVTVDYLLGRECSPSPSERAAVLMGDQLADDETELLSIFRELNGEGQEAVLAMIKGFASQSAYKKCPAVEVDNKKQA